MCIVFRCDMERQGSLRELLACRDLGVREKGSRLTSGKYFCIGGRRCTGNYALCRCGALPGGILGAYSDNGDLLWKRGLAVNS